MLSRDEKELLSVIRYANSKREETKKLLLKMMTEMSIGEICSKTGYTGHQIRSIIPIEESDKMASDDIEPVAAKTLSGKQKHLAESILDLIDSGHPDWEIGEILPTQDEIVEKFGIYRKAVIAVCHFLRNNGHIKYRNPRSPRTGYIIVKGRQA